jgi:protein-S-isoprenylcysteine O-methyltransferase Ste14
MKIKEIIRKVLFVFFWYVFLYNIVFILLAPRIYDDILNLIGVLIIFSIGTIDTTIRPFSSKERDVGLDRYTGLLFVSFLFAPVVLALSYHENQQIISKFLPIWNSLPVALVGYFLLIIGGIFTIVGRYQIGKFGSGILVIEDDHKLMKTGIYKYLRHPIYAGGVIGSFASILIFRCLFFGTIGFLYNFFVLFVRLKQEEKLLIEEFGDEYEKYMKTSKRLIPFIY